MSQLVPALAVMGHTQGLAKYLPIIESVANEMVGLDLWVYDHGAEAWLHCDADVTASIRVLAEQASSLAAQSVQVDEAAVRRDERAARLVVRKAERESRNEDYRRRMDEWETRPQATFPCTHDGKHATKKAEGECRTERAIKVVGCAGPPLPPDVIDALRDLLPPVEIDKVAGNSPAKKDGPK